VVAGLCVRHQRRTRRRHPRQWGRARSCHAAVAVRSVRHVRQARFVRTHLVTLEPVRTSRVVVRACRGSPRRHQRPHRFRPSTNASRQRTTARLQNSAFVAAGAGSGRFRPRQRFSNRALHSSTARRDPWSGRPTRGHGASVGSAVAAAVASRTDNCHRTASSAYARARSTTAVGSPRSAISGCAVRNRG